MLSIRNKINLGFSSLAIILMGFLLASYLRLSEVEEMNRQILPAFNEIHYLGRQIEHANHLNVYVEDYLILGTDAKKQLLLNGFLAMRQNMQGHTASGDFAQRKQDELALLDGLQEKVYALIQEMEADRSARLINRLVYQIFEGIDSLDTSFNQDIRDRISLLQENVLRQKILLKSTQQYFLMALLVILIFSLIISSFLSRMIRSQLVNLQKATERIAKGDLDVNIDIKTSDEIGQLAASFEKMLLDLKKITVSRDQLANEVRQRREAEEHLKKNEIEVNAILESSAYAIRVVDKDFNVVRVNAKMEALTGISAREQLLTKCYESFPEGKCDTTECPLTAILHGHAHQTTEKVIKDQQGKERIIEVSANPLVLNDKITGILVNYNDITQQREEEQKLKAAYEDSRNALLVSESLREDIQFEQEKTMAAREKLETANRDLEENERSLKNILYDMKETNDKLKAAQAQLVQSEKLASLGQLSAGVAHEINNPLGFISNNMDILAKYVDSYLQLFKLFEELEKIVNDDEREDIRRILQQIHDLEKNLNIGYIHKDIPDLIVQSKSGVDRINKIVQDLRTFSRKDEGETALVNIEEILEGVLNIVWSEIKYTLYLKKDYGGVPHVRGNAQKLGQVFINIIVNASQAVKEKGEIAIKTFVDNAMVCISIADNGQGIPEDKIDKIFDPFFTTKPVGEGTGLGLSIGYDIIKQHKGEMTVESTVGEGTKFLIKLPREKESGPPLSEQEATADI